MLFVIDRCLIFHETAVGQVSDPGIATMCRLLESSVRAGTGPPGAKWAGKQSTVVALCESAASPLRMGTKVLPCS